MICIFIGYLLSFIMPINKKLWTVSFAFITTGISEIAYLIMDSFVKLANFIKLFKCILQPLKWFGMNSIIIYVGM